MRMLIGSSRKHVDDTQTMIVVGVNRLREEYEMGKIDQMRDEHWRKQLRIAIGVGISGFGIVGALADVNAAPFVALFINLIVHVLL